MREGGHLVSPPDDRVVASTANFTDAVLVTVISLKQRKIYLDSLSFEPYSRIVVLGV